MVFVAAWAPLKNKWLKWLLVITILGTDKWQEFHSLLWQGIFLPELTFREGSLVVLQSQFIMSTALHAASEDMPYMWLVCFLLNSHTIINTWLINLSPPNDIWFLGNIRFYSFSPISKLSSNGLRVCACACACVLGESGGVVNSLDFCLASLKSWLLLQYWLLLLPVRTFLTMEGSDSEFANFILPTLKAFFEARSHNVSGNKQ